VLDKTFCSFWSENKKRGSFFPKKEPTMVCGCKAKKTTSKKGVVKKEVVKKIATKVASKKKKK
jgi:hypothetical protein